MGVVKMYQEEKALAAANKLNALLENINWRQWISNAQYILTTP